MREPLGGTIGIGHTRWATHGRPTEDNAHPHATDLVAVVHNGIIENFRELREKLSQRRQQICTARPTPRSVAHLVTARNEKRQSRRKTPLRRSLKQLRGAFALAFLFTGEDDLLIGARKGPPLAVGYGNGEMYLGSDAIALAPFTDTISYLEDGDWAVLTRKGVQICDEQDRQVERPVLKSTASAQLVDKGNHRHFMAKEIHEQPEVVGHTLAHYIDMVNERVALPERCRSISTRLKRLSISACGTAYLCGTGREILVRALCGLPIEIDIASEFRYREAPLARGGLAVFISQSGETADTLATLRYARRRSSTSLSVVNVPTSTIARESDVVHADAGRTGNRCRIDQGLHLPARALACLAIAAGRARGVLSADDEQQTGACADGSAAPHGRAPGAGTADREAARRTRQGTRRALSRPRHQFPDRARRRAEAQGNLLHPRRRLCGGRAEAWADRA